jgi:hypothetical protein
MTNYTAADALKYAAAHLKSVTNWALDSIGGGLCDGDHEDETAAIYDAVNEVLEIASRFGDRRIYSDGRRVEQYAEIQKGLVTHHVWHPDARTEEPRSWRSSLPSDPGVPSPGVYEVTLEPSIQEIHVRVVRTV